MKDLHTEAGKKPLNIARVFVLIVGCVIAIVIIANILMYTAVVNIIVFVIAGACFYIFHT